MCGREDFGNCDPETVDQEYCIFHKPNKTEEEAAEFYRKFLERFKPRVEKIEVEGQNIKRLVFDEPVDARGFVFPLLKESIEYKDESGIVWSGRNPFEFAIFKNGAIFYGAIFEGPISFKSAIFGKRSYMLKEIIQDNPLLGMIGEILSKEMAVKGISGQLSISAIFDEATFLDVVTFENSKFESNASFFNTKFMKGVLFEWSKFHGEQVMFSNSEFHRFSDEEVLDNIMPLLYSIDPIKTTLYSKLGIGVSFNGTEFKGKVMFDETVFEGASFMGAHFLADSTFDNVCFEGPAIFISAEFSGDTSFDKATFNGELTFSGTSLKWTHNLNPNLPAYEKINMPSTRFYGNVTFKETAFNSKANFSKCRFKMGAKFLSCEFNGSADFQNCEFIETQVSVLNNEWYSKFETTFAKSKFKDVAAFNFAQFGKAIFNFAMFEKVASFKNVTFHYEAQFRETKFRESVEFHDAIFIGDAKFESTSFGGLAEFYSAEFRGETTFDGSIFERLAVFVEQKDTDEKEPKPKFHDELSFSNCDFRQGVDFLGSLKEEKNLSTLWNFFSSRFSKLSALIESLRIQRLSFEKEGKRDEADRMFVLEMRAKRKLRLEQAKDDGWNYINTKTRNFVEWLLGDLPSEYGTSIKRIAIAVVAVVVLFGFLYWLTLVSSIAGIASVFVIVSLLISIWHYQTFDNYPDKFAETLRFPVGLIMIIGMLYATVSPEVDSITTRPQILLSNGTAITPTGSAGSYIGTLLNTLYYSLVTFTTLGYGDMHPTGWLKALSALEALTGAVFMALIVAVIARKWMR